MKTAKRLTVMTALLGLSLAAGTARAQDNPFGGKKPNITSARPGLYIWGSDPTKKHWVEWNHDVKLTAAESIFPDKGNGPCAFNVEYYERETNGVATGNFKNKLFSDGNERAINGPASLAASETRSITTQPYLDPGGHSLKLVLDAESNVAETNEADNSFAIRYFLEGRCGPGGAGGGNKPNITSGRPGLYVWGSDPTKKHWVPWNTAVNLTAAESIHPNQGNGQCAFNVQYFEKETNGVATAPFRNKLYSDANERAINGPFALAASEAKAMTTQPYLDPGAHSLKLVLDADGNVAETNEADNAFSIRYILSGPCGPAGAAGKK